MLCTGIPELRSADDIQHLRKAFALGSTDEAAAKLFKEKINKALTTRRTVWNDAFHVYDFADFRLYGANIVVHSFIF